MTESYEPADAARRLKAGELALVDVRDHDEWEQGHVVGALHVPVEDLQSRGGELPDDGPVAFICRTGKRSQMAAEESARSGRDAGNVSGGMEAWEQAGLPVQRGDAA